ncbi:MAG: hypothetical protein QNM02_17940 [Acidimicrobiia bacterium]|nr:hypothetical protein [Acidimicrobiia bacterium]
MSPAVIVRIMRTGSATSSSGRQGSGFPTRCRAAVAVAAVAMVSLSACSASDSPPQLERIDGPAEVDEDRLDGVPGAVNQGEERG